MKRYIILPDIHGRTFWKRPVEQYLKEDVHFIFMGDYLDPYDFEGIDVQEAIDNFKSIIEFKKSNMERVTLLFGNHDMHYLEVFKDVYKSRCIKHRLEEIRDIYEANFNLFTLAAEICSDDKRTLLTHAGITPSWIYYIKSMVNYEIENETPHKESAKKYLNDGLYDANWLNTLLETRPGMQLLWCVGRSRGGRGATGSCIWADYYDHEYYDFEVVKEMTGYDYQIFSHSLASPAGIDTYEQNDKFAMIDCRMPFIYENDKLRLLYDDNTEVD